MRQTKSYTLRCAQTPTIVGLDWDDADDPDGNVQHIAKHGVTTLEVRQVLQGAPVFREEDRYGPNPVYLAVGPTASGQLLEVHGIFFRNPPKQGYWHTITALPARPTHRRLYNEAREGS